MSLPTDDPARPEVLARLDRVRHRYADTLALDDVSLVLHPGEVLALLGPNGAGKSTLLGLLCGRLRPQEGRVELCGGDPREARSRQSLGVMLQQASLPEMLRVGELVEGQAAAYASPRSTAGTLALAGLSELAARPYGSLSGGQQRRVQFALALVGRPRLVFVDEPTTGLDADARRAFWGVLRGLRAEGVAMILTTHYIEEADALADRVVVLHRGRILAEGTPMELKARTSRSGPQGLEDAVLDLIREAA